MSKLEKIIVFSMLIGQAFGLFAVLMEENGLNSAFRELLDPIVPIIFILSLSALIIIIRDLYKRDFENPNSKLTWLFIIFFTGGIGLVIYIFKHGIKPRGINVHA